MIRWTGLCFLLLFFTKTIFGVTALPAHTIFYLPADTGKTPRPYLELYWQVDPLSVHFTKNEKDIWLGKIKTTLQISCDTGILVNKKFYLQTTPAASLDAAQLQNIMDMHRYLLPQKKIYIHLSLEEDGYEEEAFEYTDSVVVQKPPTTFYSQLQLLDTSFVTDMEQSVFLKNGRLQVPLCFNFLDDRETFLHYYVELYGTDKLKTTDTPIHQETTISNKEYDYPVFKLIHRDTLQPAKVLPINGQFKIDVLPSGNYHLNITLLDKKNKVLTKQTLFFQRSNTHPATVKDNDTSSNKNPVFEKVNYFDVSKTFVEKYNIAQLKAIMKMLLPIASQTEKLNIETFQVRPDEMYMRYFVYNFWKAHSPTDPERGWEKYIEKVRDVNKLFGSSRKPGYETERGFYYLKYGPPNQRYVVSSDEGAWPYEIWQYNAPGNQSYGGAFLFYSPGSMVGDYTLLHSTVKGERRNTSWRSQLYRNGTSSYNLNSRAEQTFTNR